jgi:hypothetical protein
MSPGRPENRSECHYIGLTRSDVVPRDIFTGSVICCFRSLFSLLFHCYFSLFFAPAGFKKPEFLRLNEVRPLYFPGFISGISERSAASKSVGRVELITRSGGAQATAGAITEMRIRTRGSSRGYPCRDSRLRPHWWLLHYAAALRKYWEIPAWRRAIASTSPLSASLSSA